MITANLMRKTHEDDFKINDNLLITEKFEVAIGLEDDTQWQIFVKSHI